MNQFVRFISCKGLVKQVTIMAQMRQMMQLIQEEYAHPVDIEFTMNLSENGEYSINLLQCRPLQVFKDVANVVIPKDVAKEDIYLESKGTSMGLSRSEEIDLVVYVDPKAYYNMPYAKKPQIANVIGKINWAYRGQGKKMILFVPGRVGTSSPELGVPTAFSDISEFELICEIEEKEAGYNPELSYGSHIFQDLVESQILYTAVFANEKTLQYAPEAFEKYPNLIGDFTDAKEIKEIVGIYDLFQSHVTLSFDLEENHLLLYRQ